MNILITGGNGYVARCLFQYLKNEYDITSITRKDFDLCDAELTKKWFADKSFDVVLHTAIVGGSRLSSDDATVIDKNLMMYYNLVSNSEHFNKLISFGSGAEVFQSDAPYGLSKKVIAKSISKKQNFYNLRLFGVFDENELETRFIKSNILRYIKMNHMIIHQDKIMDFIYMKDFIEIVKYYIENDNLKKVLDCCYEEKMTLKEIANFINTLDDHEVPIEIQCENKFDFYCGLGYNLPIPIIGLRQGIINTFRQLKI